MLASYDFTNNFHNIRIKATAGEFMKALGWVLEKYDDGQGREFDILDSEFENHDCHLSPNDGCQACEEYYGKK